MKKKCTLIALLVWCAYAVPARASAIYSFEQVGADVVGSLSGSLDVTNLTPTGLQSSATYVVPLAAFIESGPKFVAEDIYAVSGPGSFGSGNGTLATSGGGGPFSLSSQGSLLGVPSGYASGTPLSSTLLFSNQTFASMGLTPGDYVYTLGSDDTLTVRVGGTAPVPEPASMLLFGTGFGATILRLRRRNA